MPAAGQGDRAVASYQERRNCCREESEGSKRNGRHIGSGAQQVCSKFVQGILDWSRHAHGKSHLQRFRLVLTQLANHRPCAIPATHASKASKAPPPTRHIVAA